MWLVSPITKTDKLVFHMAGSMRNCLRCHHLVWIMTTSTSQTAPQSETLMFLPTHWIRHHDDVRPNHDIVDIVDLASALPLSIPCAQ